jgi:two-component system, chemotaxis family, chemotaxis protein CheY
LSYAFIPEVYDPGVIDTEEQINHDCGMCTAIVEDETALIQIYEKAFARKGIRICFVAEDGIEAVEKFNRCHVKPCVVLMDNRLPQMNGIEAAKEMLRLEPGTRIIFLSGDADAREDALNAGAFLFLKKPTSLRDIMGSIQDAMGKPTTA